MGTNAIRESRQLTEPLAREQGGKMKRPITSLVALTLALTIELFLLVVGCDNEQVNEDVNRIADELIEEGPGGTAADDTTDDGSYPVSLEPLPCHFPDTQVGYDDVEHLVVTNTWTSEVTITGWSLDMGDVPFKILDDSPSAMTLGVGDFCAISVKFSPDAVRTFTDGISVDFEYEDEGEKLGSGVGTQLQGRGVAEVGALLMEGWWDCTQTGTLMTLDFQVALRDITGQNPISLVNVYIDDMQTPAYSSGSISLTEFPPPPGMIFRHAMTPDEFLPVMVEVSAADYERYRRTGDRLQRTGHGR